MLPDASLHSSSATLVNSAPVQARSGSIVPKRIPRRGLIAKIAFPLAFLAVAVTLILLFVGILKINNGTFIYTLDDPYIHLALSDQIRHGNYGLQAGSHSAPSSSIIFPFILAIVAGTPLHPYFPLLINVCALFVSLEVIRRLILHLKLGEDDSAMVAQAAMFFLMALCFNMIGVVFTGLEHSLHIVTVAAIVYGLVLFLDSGKMPSWLPAAIVLAPLIRYEGLALSVGALLVLTLRGRFKTALATFVVIVALLGSFSLFLTKLGLSPLPSSILTKSGVAASGIDKGHGGFLPGVVENAHRMLSHPTGIVLLLVGVIAAAVCARDLFVAPRRWTSRGLMALALISMVGGQAVAGKFGWLDRYEDYVLVGTALICLYLAQATIRESLAPDRQDRLVLIGGFSAVLLVFGARYWSVTFQTPVASNNIYEQQLQMHVFVDKFYKGPIAINDLGLSSYHSPYPVLDLGGLGSEKARLMISAHASAADYEAFVAANNVHFIMVYKDWFPGQIPDTWQNVATLSLSRPHVAAAQSNVQFYVTDDATAEKVHEELEAFRKVLPPRVKLAIY